MYRSLLEHWGVYILNVMGGSGTLIKVVDRAVNIIELQS